MCRFDCLMDLDSDGHGEEDEARDRDELHLPAQTGYLQLPGRVSTGYERAIEKQQVASERERDNKLRASERETTGHEPERQQVMSETSRGMSEPSPSVVFTLQRFLFQESCHFQESCLFQENFGFRVLGQGSRV